MSTVRLLVLGALRRRTVAHGYRVYRDLCDWRADTWTSVKPGSIYHALGQLERQGRIRPTQTPQEAKLGPSRTEYTLTAQGETELLTLIEAALVSFDIVEMAAGIAFMEMLPRARVIQQLAERVAALHANETFLETLPTEAIPSLPSKHPALIGLWRSYLASAAEETEALIHSLRLGAYRFAGERSTDAGSTEQKGEAQTCNRQHNR